jgi:hypothetical protein
VTRLGSERRSERKNAPRKKKGRPGMGGLPRVGSDEVASDDDHSRANPHALIEIDDILVAHADAAG